MPLEKHLGYKYWYELYLMRDAYTSENWMNTATTISRQIGLFHEWACVIHIKDNVLHYYAASNRDISALSSNIDGITIRPIDPSTTIVPPNNFRRESMVSINASNILDLNEKYQVKRGKSIEWLSVSIRKISEKVFLSEIQLWFIDSAKQASFSTKWSSSLPAHLFAVDFTQSTKYLRQKQPKYLDIQKTMHIMRSDNIGALFEVDTFPYLPRNYYLPLDSYDFDKHSFIIGASGSGKSKFIGLFIHKLLSSAAHQQRYRIVVIDPHASLEDDLGGIKGSNVIRFKGQDDGAELFAGAGTDISAATELTGTLFKSLLADQHNPKLERVMRFSLYVLMTGQVMSLDNLKRFLTDIDYRRQLIDHVSGFIPENIVKFFGGDFNELRTKFYNESISPIVSLVEEMQMQPSLGEQNDSAISLGKLISSNPLTVFSLNKVSMGEKVVKTVAGLLIQQIFLLAQARSFNEKIILIVDEVSVVQNPALAQILAEARKYNLFVFLTQQYFGQIEKDLQDAILTNVSNYYVFRVSEEDARALEGNLTIELPKELMLEEKEIGNKEQELRVRILTSLNSRECLLRLSANGQILPGIKGKTMDFVGVSAPRVAELKPYGQSHLPSKFQEAVVAQHSLASLEADSDSLVPKEGASGGATNMIDFMGLQSKMPEIEDPYAALVPEINVPTPVASSPPGGTPSLVDFLRAQSSSPKKQERK